MCVLVCDGTQMVVLKSDGIMWNNVWSTEIVFPRIFDLVAMHVKTERDVGEVICTVCT